MRIILLTIFALGCDDAGSTPCDPETEVCCDAPEPEDIVCPEGSERMEGDAPDKNGVIYHSVVCQGETSPVGESLRIGPLYTKYWLRKDDGGVPLVEVVCTGDRVSIRIEQPGHISTACASVCETDEEIQGTSCTNYAPCPPQP